MDNGIGLMTVNYDSFLNQIDIHQTSRPRLPNQLNLNSIDAFSQKTFSDLFDSAKSKHLPYYLFVAVQKKGNPELSSYFSEKLNPPTIVKSGEKEINSNNTSKPALKKKLLCVPDIASIPDAGKSTAIVDIHKVSDSPESSTEDIAAKFWIFDASEFNLFVQKSKINIDRVHYFTLDCFKVNQTRIIPKKFNKIDACQYFHTIQKTKTVIDMKALKLKLFLIQELISISFLKKGLEDDQINRSFYTVRKLLNSYHKNIEKNKLKLTPENLLQKSGYADNFNELPPLTEHVFNTQKEKFSQLEKLSELEMEKWAISVVKYQMEITKNNLKNQNLSISNIQELTKRALNI